METKIVVFDFDGTLSRVDKGFNCWNALWTALDALEVDIKYYNMYINKEITYSKWCEIIEEEFIARKVNKKLVEDIGKKIKLQGNIEEFLKLLKDSGVKIYILSGGIKNMIQASLGELVKYITDIQADYFSYDEMGFITSLNLCEGHTIENKDEFVNLLIKQYQILPEQLLFVGNGLNDETVYKTGVRTLCVNPDGANYDNKDIWHNVLWTEDLLDVLPYVTKVKEDNNDIIK